MGKKQKIPRNILKKKAVEYKGGKCEGCGYNRCMAALTFHHKDSSKKEFGISDMMNKVDWDKIKEELDKCRLLCSNCHYELHSGLHIDDEK